MVLRELEQRGWVEEQGKNVIRVPIQERFEKLRQRPRKEMKTEVDQAHFLIGGALPGSGVNLEEELSKDTWFIRRSLEAVVAWYAKTAPEPEIQAAAKLALDLLRRSIEARRKLPPDKQATFWDVEEWDAA